MSPPAATLCRAVPCHVLRDPSGLFSTLHTPNLFRKQMLPVSFHVHPGRLQLLIPGSKETIHIKPEIQFHASVPVPLTWEHWLLTPGICIPTHVGTSAPNPCGQTQFHVSTPRMELPPLEVSGCKSPGMLPARYCHPTVLVQARQRRGSRAWTVINV